MSVARPAITEPAATRAALEAAVARVAGLIRGMSDPAVRVPGLDWTAGDVAAHLAQAFEMYGHWVRGTRINEWDLSDLAAVTNEFLAQVPHRDPDRLARDLEANASDYLNTICGRENELFRWFGGAMLPVPVGQSIALGEALIHGRDIARATRQHYRIEPHDAVLLLAGLEPIMPLAVDTSETRDLTATFSFGARGGPRTWLSFEEGRLTTERWSGQPADCHIRGEPVDLVLVFYGRSGQWGPIARARLIAWGRRPWLALRFNRLFIKPGAPVSPA